MQFKGNAQHDAQEFLLWLLDRVHEDINTNSRPPIKVNLGWNLNDANITDVQGHIYIYFPKKEKDFIQLKRTLHAHSLYISCQHAYLEMFLVQTNIEEEAHHTVY